MNSVHVLYCQTRSVRIAAVVTFLGVLAQQVAIGHPQSNVCEHLADIKSIPNKPGTGETDPIYKQISASPKSAESCLLARITDSTPMADPQSEPTSTDSFAVGDLAFFLLSDFHFVSFEGVLPEVVRKDLHSRGAYAYFEWVKQPGSRQTLQANCEAWIAAYPQGKWPVATEVYQGRPIVHSTQLVLLPRGPTPEERVELEKEALRGSTEAAERLATSAFFSNDIDQANYWLTIGAENGDPHAMYLLWSTRQMVVNPKLSKERGMYWLKRAADLGNKYAIQELRMIDAQQALPKSEKKP